MKKTLIAGGILLFMLGFVLLFKQEKPKNNDVPSQKIEIKIGQDICGEFPKEWIQSIINKTITRAEELDSSGTYTCQYYLDKDSFVTLRLSDLNFESQKNGQRTLGRSLTENAKIALPHFIAIQENGVINDIVLEVNPTLIFAVDRSSLKALTEIEITDFAIKVAERISKGENQGQIVAVPTASIAPSLQEKEVINTFFQLIEEGKASDAVMMMGSQIINSESTKQAYAVQFNAMTSVKITKIEEAMRDEWTETRHEYMVTLDVVMNPNSANGPIPYYGFEKGENVRFITLVKEGGEWKIEGLATGP